MRKQFDDSNDLEIEIYILRDYLSKTKNPRKWSYLYDYIKELEEQLEELIYKEQQWLG